MRVVVTGVGVVSTLAVNAERHFARLLAGDCGLRALDGGEYRNYPGVLLGKVTEFDRRELIPHRMLRKLLSPSSAHALVAAVGALRDAGFEAGCDELRQCGLYAGSVCLDINPEAFIPALKESINEENRVDLERFATNGMHLIDPLFLVRSLPNAGVGAIAIQEQVLGANLNITNGAVSGLQAVMAAAAAIRRGDVEFALAGGYDTLIQMDSIVEHLLAGNLSNLTAEPHRACRAFDSGRSGMALGEGSAFVLLESEEHACRRGAPVYGELEAWSQRTCAANLLKSGRQQDPASDSSLAKAARETLSRAECEPSEVDIVFGDGLATEAHDTRELQAAWRVFGGGGQLYTAAAGAIGFTGAASGTFSLLHAAMAMRRKLLPPLLNCENPVPQSSFTFVREALPRAIRRAMVWNDDRGVKSAAVLLRSYE